MIKPEKTTSFSELAKGAIQTKQERHGVFVVGEIEDLAAATPAMPEGCTKSVSSAQLPERPCGRILEVVTDDLTGEQSVIEHRARLLDINAIDVTPR